MNRENNMISDGDLPGKRTPPEMRVHQDGSPLAWWIACLGTLVVIAVNVGIRLWL